ncbi:MAG: hypothetical protein JO107_09900 [Hyphomicrobiales bacterium]|nr:hypothetical protein [Hyphomicrobiales bacterium]MBV8663403.1 hypothetical protein [Hyphomicrobiales bacterium]
MTKFAFSAAFESLYSIGSPALGRQSSNHHAFARRLDRIGSRSGGVTGAPQHLDARLLEDGVALEAAWQAEVGAMIAFRRERTPQSQAALAAARAACGSLVTRIETSRALTLDGLKVQARAVLWRRDGEPLGPEIPDEAERNDAWSDMGELPNW